MGDANTTLDEPGARQLLRRATFDGSPAALAAARIQGLTRGQAADKLLAVRPTAFRPSGQYFEQMHGRWIRYLLRARAQVQAKLALFWHDHFATSYAKVGNLRQMQQHVKTLHASALGDLRVFVKAINRDPAMIEFLDTQRNHRENPNENYARELLELFTLGVTDRLGNPNYTQDDIVQIARAFTGWRHDGGIVTEFRADRHDFSADYPGRGPKAIFQDAHGFPAGGASLVPAAGEGPGEIDQVIDVLFQHRDSEGRNTVARRIASRLLAYYAYPDPEPTVVDEVLARSADVTGTGFETSFDVKSLLRAIFTHDALYATQQGAQRSVKWPVHFVVGALRMTRVRLRGRDPYLDAGSYSTAHEHMSNMGQILADPPSVFGWNWESGWISAATLLARFQFGRDLAASRYGPYRLRLDRLMDLTLTDPGAIVDAVLRMLDVDGATPAADRATLLDYLTDAGGVSSIDLQDEQVRNTKLHGLIGLVLQSPASHVV